MMSFCLNHLVPVLHWLGAFIVLAEGLNKLHRTDPLAAGLSGRARVVVLLKVLAWVFLVLAAAGSLVRPFVVVAVGVSDVYAGHVLLTDRVSLVDLLFTLGFAVLIVRSRLKE